MNRTILPFVLIFLGLQFHGVSAGDLGRPRWSNQFDPSTGTLALEPQKTPAPAHEVAVKEFYWTTGPRGEPVFVHNPSLQHQSAESTHTSSPTDSGCSSGDEGGASRPDLPLKNSAKNHRKELYWGTDSRGKPRLIREKNSLDKPPGLIKHTIIPCKGDDCKEDFQNDRGSENKDLNDAAEIPSEDSPEEPGDLEETTSDSESDHFSANDSQERGHWSPDGDSEIRAEENNPKTSESLNRESDEETYQSEPEGDRQEEESSNEKSDEETYQSEPEGDRQEEESLPADTSWKTHDPINDVHTVEAGGGTLTSTDIEESDATPEQIDDIFGDFSHFETGKSPDIMELDATPEQIDNIFGDFSHF